MIGYIITSIISLLYLVFGIIYIINKKDFKITKVFKTILVLFVSSCFVIVVIEAITNSNYFNSYCQLHIPYHDMMGVYYIIGIITIILPDNKYRVVYTLLFILSLAILLLIGNYTIYHMKNYVRFYEKFGWYVLGLITIILYAFYKVRLYNDSFKFKNIVISIAIVLAIYLMATIHNYILNTNILGLAFNDNYYFANSIRLKDYKTSMIVNYISIILSMIICSFIKIKSINNILDK